jgi:hypothetical protein
MYLLLIITINLDNYLKWMSEWLLFNIIFQLHRKVMTRTSYILWGDDVCFVLYHQAEFDLYSLRFDLTGARPHDLLHCRFWIWFLAILIYFFWITWVFIEYCVISISFRCFGIAFFKIFSSDIQFCLFLNLAIILYSEIRPYSSKISLIKIISLFIQLTVTKHCL